MATAPKPGSTREPRVVLVTVNGETYPFSPDEISAVDAASLRKATGMSLRSVLDSATKDPDIDVVAALLWLSRRQNGEPNLPYDAVAAEVHYTSKFELSSGTHDEDDDSPEA
jgi:hypothetical protein